MMTMKFARLVGSSRKDRHGYLSFSLLFPGLSPLSGYLDFIRSFLIGVIFDEHAILRSME